MVATELEGMSVQLSDPERTLIDLLDFPELAGGVEKRSGW